MQFSHVGYKPTGGNVIFKSLLLGKMFSTGIQIGRFSATFSSLVVGGGLSSVISFFRSSSRLDLAVWRWGDWEPRRLALSWG